MAEAPRIHLTGGRGVQIGDGNTMHVHPRIAWGSLWPEQAGLPSARRVFLSHAGELRELPKPRSFVAAAESAVARADDAVAVKPADADVHVLIAGFCYGSLVHDVSGPEQEFQTAGDNGLPRMVFVLGDETIGPPALFRDLRYGARQEAFRQRLLESGIDVTTVSTPDQLETALLEALTKLPRSRRQAGRIWGIPARTVEFTGREALLSGLREALCSGEPAVVQAVQGMAGVGKTTTALEYAHRYHDDYDVAWWIPSEDPDLIAGRLADLARALDLATEQDSSEAALARLRGMLRGRDRWLLVFDNAENAGTLQPFLPGGDGHVIITSRNPDWAGVAATLPVREFTRPESIQVLRSRLPELSDEDADRVADVLGDLPLAVDQAAWLLSANGWTADTYLELHAQRTEELLDRREQTSGYPTSVAAAWTLSFEYLERHHPAALLALTFIAWLAPEPVPLTLLTQQPDELPEELASVVRDPLAFADVTTVLRARGMADVTATTVQLHRVPAALLRGRDSDHDWPAAAVRVLDVGLPEYPWNNPASWPLWRQLLPHILIVTDELRDLVAVGGKVANLLNSAAVYLCSRGDYRSALPHAERSYRLSLDSCGEDHFDASKNAHNLAWVLREIGEHRRAYNLNVDTFARRRNLLGEDHPDTLLAANGVAISLVNLGEYERARTIHEDTLARRKRILGEDHPDTLASANNLAACLSELGIHRLARELDEDTFTRRKRLLGDDHPATLVSAYNLGVVLRALGEDQKARDVHQDVLARRKRVLGENHPDTLKTARALEEFR